MVTLEKLWVFDMIAAAFTGIVIFGASSRDVKATYIGGSACTTFWFIVTITGYVAASASLWQMD